MRGSVNGFCEGGPADGRPTDRGPACVTALVPRLSPHAEHISLLSPSGGLFIYREVDSVHTCLRYSTAVVSHQTYLYVAAAARAFDAREESALPRGCSGGHECVRWAAVSVKQWWAAGCFQKARVHRVIVNPLTCRSTKASNASPRVLFISFCWEISGEGFLFLLSGKHGGIPYVRVGALVTPGRR